MAAFFYYSCWIFSFIIVVVTSIIAKTVSVVAAVAICWLKQSVCCSVCLLDCCMRMYEVVVVSDLNGIL